ncbi:MAG TPA: hypothetical protein VIO94_11475 [Phenylobacterium sp.]
MSDVPGDDLPRLRIAGRIAADFLLRVVRTVAGPRDLTDTLILVATVQANVSPILRDPALQRAYASLDAPPPEHLRRPISVNAVAGSLGLPFETVRRRIGILSAAGACTVTARGVVVPELQLNTPEHCELLSENLRQVRELYRQLRWAGCLEPAAETPDPLTAPPVRAVARVSSEYALRMVEPIVGYLGDLTDGFLLMAILDLNTRHLPTLTGPDIDPGYVADSLRKPAAVGEIAKALGLGYELTRRRLKRLAQAGLCEIAPAGVVVPIASLIRPGGLDFMVANLTNLRRMFASLAPLGITQAWEVEQNRELRALAS